MNTQKEQKKRRDAISKVITSQRTYEYRHVPTDDTKVNGELIGDAQCYLDLARKQIMTRDMKPLEEMRNVLHPGGKYHFPPGGSNHGYSAPDYDNPPTDFSQGVDYWDPGYPRDNILKAIMQLQAELERLDRQDQLLLNGKGKVTTREANDRDRIREGYDAQCEVAVPMPDPYYNLASKLPAPSASPAWNPLTASTRSALTTAGTAGGP